jgi:phage FluMu protein Com
MEEIRCGDCGKLLAKGEVVTLTIKCPRCGAINHLRATSPNQESPGAPRKERDHGD